jgi:hypothetical protein
MVAGFVIAALGVLLLIQNYLFARYKNFSGRLVLGLVERIVQLQKDLEYPNPDDIFLPLSEKLSKQDIAQTVGLEEDSE